MEFIFIASAHFMALVSPGPDFFLIIQTATRYNRLYAFALCCGIALANGVYIIISVAGLEQLKDFDYLIVSMKYMGAVYLLYIGISLLFSPKRSLLDTHSDIIEPGGVVKFFGRGFLAAILNPKNMIFYLSLFTVMVSQTTPVATRALYGAWMFSAVLLWDVFVAFLLSHPMARMRFGNVLFFVEKLSGTLLAGCGLALPFS